MTLLILKVNQHLDNVKMFIVNLIQIIFDVFVTNYRLIGRMLVREPEKRATLSEIATDPWVTADEGVTVEDFDTPLVAKEQLSEEDRSAIVQKMVNGPIASKEEILEALEKNEYNHLTATYYLLAERKLRSKR